jgi:hypothetical protein
MSARDMFVSQQVFCKFTIGYESYVLPADDASALFTLLSKVRRFESKYNKVTKDYENFSWDGGKPNFRIDAFITETDLLVATVRGKTPED